MPKRIIFPKKGGVVFEEFELRAPIDSEVRVKTLFSLMSIGTETIILHQKYDENTHFAQMFSFPQLKTGVQAIGRVEAKAEAADNFKVGDLVYMRAAHGSHQLLDESLCSPIPDDIEDLKSASWAGLAKTAFRAAWAGDLKPESHVLIIGAGPVGQMTVRWVANANVATLAVADVSGFRLEYAKQGGAALLIQGDIASSLDKISLINKNRGPDLVIDTTGNAEVFGSALAAAGQFGKVILLGDSGYPSKQCLSSEVMTKGLTIQATHDSHDLGGWTQRKIDARFFDLLHKGKFNLTGLITHEFRPDQCVEAYQQADNRRGESMGILYDWTQTDY
ncbi:MAG: zinc-binding dehydrogenase [Gammaproteobacteria bacterium]|nr:zinc-binding dehydrogenase [Gammaproteobacteria bacterium]